MKAHRARLLREAFFLLACCILPLAARAAAPPGLATEPRVDWVTPQHLVAHVAGNQSFDDLLGPALSAGFRSPNGGFVGPHGEVFIADTDNHRIKKLTSEGRVVLVAGNPIQGHQDGPANQSFFRYPMGVCADASGNVFVADAGNHCIRKITPDGQVSTFAGNGRAGIQNGKGTAAQFNYPTDLALAPDGSLYVTEFEGNWIRVIAPDGEVSSWSGKGLSGIRDGLPYDDLIRQPSAITVDSLGNVYFAEWGRHVIRRINLQGIVSTIAGNGSPGHRDGPALSASFNQPDGLAVDAAGNLIIADRRNAAVRRLTPTGIVETVAVIPKTIGFFSPPPASFNQPQPSGIGVATDGSIYVVDTGIPRILRVAPKGQGPFVFRQPQDKSALSNSVFSLRFEALEEPPVVYQWFRDGIPIPGETWSVLNFTAFGPQHDGAYSVTASYISGVITSRLAQVRLVDTVGPRILRPPESLTVQPGSTVILTAEATGTGTLSYTWARDSYDFPVQLQPSFALTNVLAATHAGNYTVTVRDDLGKVTSAPATLTVLPPEPPRIIAKSETLDVREGTLVTLFVEATGHHPLTYQWASSPGFSTEGPSPTIRGATNAQFVFTAWQRSTPWMDFWCDIQDRFGMSTGTGPIRVYIRPATGPYITLDPIAQEDPKLATRTLFVDVAGGEAPHLQWLRNGVPIPGATLPSLTFSPLGIGCCAGGVYSVDVSDDFGHTNRSASTDAQPLASLWGIRVIRPPDSVVALPGANATLSAEVWIPEAYRQTPTEYRWFRNGTHFAYTPTPSLTLTNVSDAEVGQYRLSLRIPNTGPATLLRPVRLDLAIPRHLAHPTHSVSRIAGQSGVAGDGTGPALSALLNTPLGGCFDVEGDFLFADSGNHRIKRLTQDGFLLPIAGDGKPGLLNGPAAESRFRTPTDVALGIHGELYVADSGNHAIRQILPDGTVRTVAGTGAPGGMSGPAATATFSVPLDLAVTAEGALLIAEYAGHSIRRLSRDGHVTRWIGSREAGMQIGLGPQARLYHPKAAALDRHGLLQFVDTGNFQFLQADAQGQTTSRGVYAGTGFADGPVAASYFRGVEALATDPSGHLLLADAGNHALRRLSPSGMVDTLAGTGFPGSEDGPVESASFSSPSGVAVAPDGSVFVADTGNHTIRRIVPTSGARLSVGRTTPTGSLTLTWPAGVLQSAGSLLGPWSEVPQASSPYPMTPTGELRFFRVR